MKPQIRLKGINGDIEGKVWESDTILRVGRVANLEIVLDDSTVSHHHAEVRFTSHGWRVRDLGSTDGTTLNGNRLGPGEWQVRAHDILGFGNVTVVVDFLRESRDEDEAGIKGVAPAEKLQALLRAGNHLVHLENEEDLLHTILNDAVATMAAQGGAIVLAEGPSGPLRLRALATGQNSQIPGRPGFSQNLAERSFNSGESILCSGVLCSSVEEDPELIGARSSAEGTMASVLCVVLRTPRKKLGVLQLERGPLQKPFTKDDLHLADALAAQVFAGIESAQLIEKQKSLFLETIRHLAKTVELRDDYTGQHSARVTRYSVLLGQELGLSSEEMKFIKIGTPLHDIGKIGIDDAILRKPANLTTEEFEIMKTHTIKGAQILEQGPELASIVPIVRSHHERWDGLGYPDGLAGEDIPRLARIVAVANAFDSMTSDLPYRNKMSAFDAFSEVEKHKGKQFDPEVVNALLRIRPRIVEDMQSSGEGSSSQKGS